MSTLTIFTDFQQRRKAISQRSSEDFDFMVLCEAKGNRGMYRLLRDTTIESDRTLLDAQEAFFGVTTK